MVATEGPEYRARAAWLAMEIELIGDAKTRAWSVNDRTSSRSSVRGQFSRRGDMGDGAAVPSS